MADFTKGQLLVATPVLHDPNFDRTVIAMLEHSADGALGVVLNRPTDTPVDDVVPSIVGPLLRAGDVVYHGGPVSPEVAIAIAEAEHGTEGFTEVASGIGTLDLPGGVADGTIIPYGAMRCKLYAGYSSWGPGQLEGEIESGAWFVLELWPDDPFLPDPNELWPWVLNRQENEIRWFANYPDNIHSN